MSKLKKSLILDYALGSYPIHIGHGLIGEPAMFANLTKYHHITIVSDEIVAPHYLHDLSAVLSKKNVTDIILPSGEHEKTLQTIERICGELISTHAGRKSVLIALGGGVIGDITGFAAACYQRGIDFVQVPTTLLAQVDSSVGGKTGVNHSLGKNMIGAFHQPQAVIADLDTLKTLPPRQISAGIAEIIKYGLILDADFFAWLEHNMSALRALETEAVVYAVYRSCQIKAEVVAQDEKETSGYRMLLNLGHTFGHAIETGLGHKGWLHGEAVACGMVMAAKFSVQRGWISPMDLERIIALIEQAGLPVNKPDDLGAEKILELMQHDKKNVAGKQCLVLLQDIGRAVVCEAIEPGELNAFFNRPA